MNQSQTKGKPDSHLETSKNFAFDTKQSGNSVE